MMWAPGDVKVPNPRQRGWFDLSPKNAKQIVITSGHDAASNEPELVLDAILDVLAEARAG